MANLETTMNLDIAQLIADIQTAISSELNADVTSFKGFAKQQLQAIAEQTERVARGIASGEITAGTRNFFLQGIKDMSLNFVKTLQGLLIVSIEKIWNTMLNVIFLAISKATGLNISIPQS